MPRRSGIFPMDVFSISLELINSQIAAFFWTGPNIHSRSSTLVAVLTIEKRLLRCRDPLTLMSLWAMFSESDWHGPT